MLKIWTIYDHPTDYPDNFVARLFLLDKPTTYLVIASTLDDLRGAMREAGLIQLDRSPGDDPKIVETWM